MLIRLLCASCCRELLINSCGCPTALVQYSFRVKAAGCLCCSVHFTYSVQAVSIQLTLLKIHTFRLLSYPVVDRGFMDRFVDSIVILLK